MRVRRERWELLLELCQSDPELVTNKFSGPEGKSKLTALWQTVVMKLNSLGFGDKTVEGWKKTLTDWKSKKKSKAAALRMKMQRTGGDPPSLPPLLPWEIKLREIMGNKAIEGDKEIPELGFGHVTIPENKETSAEILQETAGVPGPSTPIDHDYSNVDTNKRRLEEPSRGASSGKRRRVIKTTRTKSEIIQMTQHSLNLLSNINLNIESCANSLKLIASVMQNQGQ